MNRAYISKIITIACLFFALCAGNVSGALPEERPGAFEMVIDVPIRIISLGLAMVGTAFFIVALPFALSSGSTGTPGMRWWLNLFSSHSPDLLVNLTNGRAPLRNLTLLN